MTRKLQTGLAFILLLVAFSCTKENDNSPFSSSGSSKALTSTSADEAVVAAPDISWTGSWVLHYSWGCTGSFGTTTIKFNSNGTFSTGSGNTGHYVSSAIIILWKYDSYNTSYAIRVNKTEYTGIAGDFANQIKGCAFLTKPGALTEPSNQLKGQPDDAGKR